jgi:hypothetical protein
MQSSDHCRDNEHCQQQYLSGFAIVSTFRLDTIWNSEKITIEYACNGKTKSLEQLCYAELTLRALPVKSTGYGNDGLMKS